MRAIDRLRHRREWSTSSWVFAAHVAIYLAVNAGLFAINLLTGVPPFWFLFPLWGGGILLAGHAGYLVAPDGLVGTDIGLFVVTVSGLTVIDFIYSSSRWFYWPLLVWGALVLIHLGVARGVGFSRVWAAETPRPIGSTSRVLMSVLLSLSLLMVIATIGSGVSDGLATSGSGPVKTVTRTLAPFSAIEVSGQGTLAVSLGPAPAIAITGDDNIVSYVETRVSHGKLTVALKSPWYRNVKPKLDLEYRVTVPSLSAITLHDGVTADLPSLRTDRLGINLYDGTRLTIAQLNTPHLAIGLSDGARLTVQAGTVNETTIDAHDAAQANLAGLASQRVTVSTNGIASVTVHATQDLAATAMDVSHIRYLGSPHLSRRNTSSLGRIDPISP